MIFEQFDVEWEGKKVPLVLKIIENVKTNQCVITYKNSILKARADNVSLYEMRFLLSLQWHVE